MNRKTCSADQPAILGFVSYARLLAPLENLFLPYDRNRRPGAMRNRRVEIGITFLVVMFTLFLRITTEDEAIRTGKRSVHLNTIQKMLESHCAGNGCSSAMQFVHRIAIQQ